MTQAQALMAGIPSYIEKAIIDAHKEIVHNYRIQKWEPSELNGGKLCESIYCLVHGVLTGNFPAAVSKPANFPDACKTLEGIKPAGALVGERSLRILIPRSLPYIYEIRNNRGVGHVGGDVNPNHMDSLCILSFSNWVVAELVRIFHSVTISEAQAIVDQLTERHLPSIWKEGAIKRVLDNRMSIPNQTLILLCDEGEWTDVDLLFSWVEYSKNPITYLM